MTSLPEANAKSAFDLLRLLSKEHPFENIILSPLNLSTALGLLHYGSQCDIETVIEKVFPLNKVKADVSSGTRDCSEAETGVEGIGSKQQTYLPKFPCAQVPVCEAIHEAEEGTSSLPTSGEDETQADSHLVASLAETIPHSDAEESASTYFIPWRKHLLGIDEADNLIQEESSPEEILCPNTASPHRNAEEQSTHENMAIGDANLPTPLSDVAVTPENINTLLLAFKQTVEHADVNVQAFKGMFINFKECCDNMCSSMSDLQSVLETLIAILRE